MMTKLFKKNFEKVFLRWLGVCLFSLLCSCTKNNTLSKNTDDGVSLIQDDLKLHVQSLEASMPQKDTEGFAKPSPSELTQWRTLIQSLSAENLPENLNEVVNSVAAHFPSYQLIRFEDTGNNLANYYILEERPNVVKGWGAFFINPTAKKELAIEVPHPISDASTPTQSVEIFRKTQSRYLILAGAHRCANTAPSTCDGTTSVCGTNGFIRESDMAHVANAPFEITHEVIRGARPALYFLNLHGNNDTSSCGDLFLSSGFSSTVATVLSQFRKNLPADTHLDTRIIGDSNVVGCPHTGTTNVQGRFTNGSLQPCTQSATTVDGHFIHIEQSINARTNTIFINDIITSLNLTF